MNIRTPSSAEAEMASAAVSMAGKAMKDTLGAQLINKTLDKLNGAGGIDTASAMNQSYQFQKEVLGAAGIGNKLDMFA